MNDSTDNHTIRLLQEMRAETNSRFDDVTQRIDGNTLLLNLLAGLLHDHEQRVTRLEGKSS